MLTVLRRRKSAAVLVAGTATVALLLGACSGSTSNDAVAAGTNDIAATPRDQVADGGTLRFPIAQSTTNFNLNQADVTGYDANVVSPMLPAPFDFSADATPSVDKDYFSDIVLTSTKPQVVTYTINPKAKWNNGNPISYKDFVAQWKALNGSNPDYQVLSTTGYDQIKSISRGANNQVVTVTFAKAYADWKALFSGLYPASVNATPDAFNNSLKEDIKVTAGPFKFDNLNKTTKTVTIVRDDKWWGEPAKLDRIVFPVIDETAQIDALANGEIDFVDIGADKDAYKKATENEAVTVRRASGPNFRHITFNGTAPNLKDQDVRIAIQQGINRQQIADALLGPLGGTPTVLNNHIFMGNQNGYKDNSAVVAFDQAKAKAGLEAAGWTLAEGDKFRKKGGKELTLNLLIPSGTPAPLVESPLIQSQLKDIGVNVKIVAKGDDFFDFVSNGTFDMTIFTWVGTPFPISSSKSIYQKPEGDNIFQNFARIGTKNIDDLFDQAAAELDPAKAIDLANKADAAIWAEGHSLTTYQKPELIACNNNLVNYGAVGFASLKYQDIGFKKGSQQSATPAASTTP
jgi:peptide/nickel transport system substrate-binding protein